MARTKGSTNKKKTSTAKAKEVIEHLDNIFQDEISIDEILNESINPTEIEISTEDDTPEVDNENLTADELKKINPPKDVSEDVQKMIKIYNEFIEINNEMTFEVFIKKFEYFLTARCIHINNLSIKNVYQFIKIYPNIPA